MAVSRRLRYEILRRDNHQCRYCGATAPDVPLTVDHVTPVALGGSDDPTNLVTACKDCNAGKSSSNPDQPLVDDVSADALRWGRAMQAAADQRVADRRALDSIVAQFDQAWLGWSVGTPEDRQPVPRDPNWRASIYRFIEAGLEAETMIGLARDAMECDVLKAEFVWRSFCRRSWDEITARQELARQLVDQPASRPTSALASALREHWLWLDEEGAHEGAEAALFVFRRAMELWTGGRLDDAEGQLLNVRTLIECIPDVDLDEDASAHDVGDRLAAQALTRHGVRLDRLVMEPR
jgi:hypothetical protein